jgi:hypothetical protein
MPEIEISDKTVKIKPKTMDRLIPAGGVEISLDDGTVLKYIDSNDLPRSFRDSIIETIKNNPYPNDSAHIAKGSSIGKTFRVFVFIQDQPIIVYSFYERTGGDFGYGVGDFQLNKYVFPEYQRDPISRAASVNLFMIISHSGIMKKIYSFMKANENIKSGGGIIKEEDPPIESDPPPDMEPPIKTVWPDQIDMDRNPCLSELKETDNEESFLAVTKTFDTEKGKFAVFELNCGLNQQAHVDASSKIKDISNRMKEIVS